MKKYFKYILILVILIGIFFGYKQIKAQSNETIPTKFTPKTLKEISVSRQDIKEVLILSGSIDAEKKSVLKFQTSGMLAWVGVKVGDRVKKWQAIAGLDQKELRKNLQKEFNDYQTDLSKFNDTQDTYKETKERLLVTDEIKRVIDRSQYSLNNAVISYELNDIAIKYSTLTTPIEGVITAIDQSVPGVNITPTSATFTVVDPSTVFLKAEIDQEDTPKIKVGQSAIVRLDSFSDQVFDSKINFIAFSPVAGQSNTVYEIRFDLSITDNKNLDYRLGMDGDAEIILAQSENALTLPIEAISEENNQKYVLVKDENNKISKKNIKTGIETDTEIEILEGLNENDKVIVKQK